MALALMAGFGFVAIMVALSLALGRHPVQLIAALVPVATVFIVICAKSTRGGWRSARSASR